MGPKHGVVAGHQLALANGCCCLELFHELGPLREAQFVAAQTNGTTGDQHQARSALPLGAEVGRQRLQELITSPQQAGAHLDHQGALRHWGRALSTRAPHQRARVRSLRCSRSWFEA